MFKFIFLLPLHPAGEGKGEGEKFFSISSLPLRERIKVRGAVKFLSFLIKSKDKSSYLPLTLLK
jgi:hypothetical protein